MALKATAAQVRAFQTTLDGDVEEVTTRKKSLHEEAQHQAALMQWRDRMQESYPNLQFLFSTLNGVFMPPHIRAKAIEAGMAKGVLDLIYLVRYEEKDGGFSGLVMDLKKLKGGKPTPDQIVWAKHLVAQGFLVLFPEGCLEAWRCLCCFEGITGRDHIAQGLMQREESIRRICGV